MNQNHHKTDHSNSWQMASDLFQSRTDIPNVTVTLTKLRCDSIRRQIRPKHCFKSLFNIRSAHPRCSQFNKWRHQVAAKIFKSNMLKRSKVSSRSTDQSSQLDEPNLRSWIATVHSREHSTSLSDVRRSNQHPNERCIPRSGDTDWGTIYNEVAILKSLSTSEYKYGLRECHHSHLNPLSTLSSKVIHSLPILQWNIIFWDMSHFLTVYGYSPIVRFRCPFKGVNGIVNGEVHRPTMVCFCGLVYLPKKLAVQSHPAHHNASNETHQFRKDKRGESDGDMERDRALNNQ
jgi:hypothetical protein